MIVRPFRRGHCEAGVMGVWREIERLPACDKRGRWMVNGSILCGGCKRLVEKGTQTRRP